MIQVSKNGSKSNDIFSLKISKFPNLEKFRVNVFVLPGCLDNNFVVESLCTSSKEGYESPFFDRHVDISNPSKRIPTILF